MKGEFKLLILAQWRCFALFVATLAAGHGRADISFKAQWIQMENDSANLVATQGNYAFVTTLMDMLRIFDISDESNPVPAGKIAQFSLGRDLAFHGDYIYVAGSYGVQIINATDKLNPIALKIFGVNCDTVTTEGNRLYVSTEGKLDVYDILNPSEPQLLGSFSDAGASVKFAIQNGLAFGASRSSTSGFQILDVSNPQVISRLAVINTPDAVKNINLAGNLAYVVTWDAGGGGTRFTIYDITNPLAPGVLSNTMIPTGAFSKLRLANSTAILADLSGNIAVFDISNPRQPAMTSLFDPGSSNDLALAGDDIFIANGNGGLRIVNIADRFNPKSMGVYGFSSSFQGLAIGNSKAYITDQVENLVVFDISDPAAPKKLRSVSSFATPIGSPVIDGTRLYVLYSNSFQIFDLTDPARPQNIGGFTNNAPMSVIKPMGQYLIATAPGSFQVLMLDVSAPKDIKIAATLDLLPLGIFYSFGGIDGIGSNVFIPTSRSILTVNISNPLHPVIMGQYPNSDDIQDLKTDDHYLYLGGYNGLRIFDTANPNQFMVVGQSAVATIKIALGENRAITSRGVSLDVLDISDAANPMSAGTFYVSQTTLDLKARGSLAFSVLPSYFLIWETTLPARPTGPRVSASLSGSGLTLRWPDTATGYKLYSTANFAQPWQLVIDNPPHEGSEFSYTNRFPLAPAQFYKLVK